MATERQSHAILLESFPGIHVEGEFQSSPEVRYPEKRVQHRHIVGQENVLIPFITACTK